MYRKTPKVTAKMEAMRNAKEARRQRTYSLSQQGGYKE